MKIKEETEQKVFSYIEKHGMITAGDKIVVGVSGGADSVCLLLLLLEYRKKTSLSLAVVHVNHGIRADAGEDARYVERLCAEWEIPFYLRERDVRGLAAAEKRSEEDAGRQARYEAFAEVAQLLGGAKLAVAHNQGDNAETMLFHLFRGSGLKGLCGIAPVRDDIIRPLLCLQRREIEAYLKDRQVGWRTDSTNGGDEYSRNRIRHHILPYAEKEIAQGAVSHMCRTAELLTETEDYLELQTAAAVRQCVTVVEEGGRYEISVSLFQPLHAALQKRILFAVVRRLSPTGKDISAVHVENVLTLFSRGENRNISLPFGITARRRYETVIFERGQERESGTEEADLPDRLEISTLFPAKGQEVPKNKYTKWFDYDKIKESPVVRFRRAGDYLTLTDGKGKLIHKTLKDYMITEKIPRELRDRIPVVASGSHILWLVGYRISEYFKVSANTNRILQVELKRDCPLGEKTEEKNVGTH